MGFQNLLNWISGRSPVGQTRTTASQSERRRFQRIDLAEGKLTIGSEGSFPINNISYGGVRIDLRHPELLGNFPSGRVFEGRIDLLSIHFATRFKVCNVVENFVGCSFDNLSSAHSRIVSEFMKPRIIGASLQEINASTLQNRDPGLRLRWFQGDEGAQIFLWQTLNGGTVKEEYYFLDYLITWDNVKHLLQTGRISDSGGKAGFGRIDPSSVAFFQVPSHRALKMGKVILENAGLPIEAVAPLLNGISREERRLYFRYVLKENDSNLRFYPGKSREGFFRVANLSFNGLALALPEGEQAAELERGQELEGELQIGERFITVQVRLSYSAPQLIGGNMRILDPDKTEILAGFLAPRILGQSLEELPAPMEEEVPFAPSGSRSYLFVGLHNTHILSLIAPGNRLVNGRIVFMDKVVRWEHSLLTAYSCPRGIIFPRDWDLPHELVEPIPTLSPETVAVCSQMIEAARIPEEMRKAWEKVLLVLPEMNET